MADIGWRCGGVRGRPANMHHFAVSKGFSDVSFKPHQARWEDLTVILLVRLSSCREVKGFVQSHKLGKWQGQNWKLGFLHLNSVTFNGVLWQMYWHQHTVAGGLVVLNTLDTNVSNSGCQAIGWGPVSSEGVCKRQTQFQLITGHLRTLAFCKSWTRGAIKRQN